MYFTLLNYTFNGNYALQLGPLLLMYTQYTYTREIKHFVLETVLSAIHANCSYLKIQIIRAIYENLNRIGNGSRKLQAHTQTLRDKMKNNL